MSSEGLPTTRLTAAHQRWEYRVITIGTRGLFGPSIDIDQIGQYLMDVGADGWELVSVAPVDYGSSTNQLLAVFKRPILA